MSFNMHRNTSDYSPLQPHTDEYKEAVSARKEMMKFIDQRGSSKANQPKRAERTKSWRGQMRKNARNFDSYESLKRHHAAQRRRDTEKAKLKAV